MDDKKDKLEPSQTQPPGKPPLCTCLQDPFKALPPELSPHRKSVMDALRKVTCPGCGLDYWTNRKTDLCIDCEKKGVRMPGD